MGDKTQKPQKHRAKRDHGGFLLARHDESTLLCVAMDQRDEDKDLGSEDEAPEAAAEAAEEKETERESSEPPPPKSEAKSGKGSGSKAGRSGKAKREARAARDDRRQVSATAAPGKLSTQAMVIAVAALAAGAAAGWFGHQARAKAQLKAESSPAAAGSAGPCGQWQEKICGETGGERSAACQQAKAATELLTPGTCETALTTMPATIEKIKAGRATCDNLVTKLCNDLPKDSAACAMVKERTPSFPSDRCKGMLDQYDQVLAQLKQIDEQGGGMMGGGRPPGAPPGGMPHGGPPGAMPRGGPPGGATPHGGPPGTAPKAPAH